MFDLKLPPFSLPSAVSRLPSGFTVSVCKETVLRDQILYPQFIRRWLAETSHVVTSPRNFSFFLGGGGSEGWGRGGVSLQMLNYY